MISSRRSPIVRSILSLIFELGIEGEILEVLAQRAYSERLPPAVVIAARI
jgi:hypothetical protein